MDFVDWCDHLLKKMDEASTSPEALRLGFLTDNILAQTLFGEQMSTDFVGSPQRTHLHTAFDDLARNQLVTKKRSGQMYTIEVTPLGRTLSKDMRPLWKEIFTVKLRPEAEQLLQIVNRLSQKTEPVMVWVEGIEHECLLQHGWENKEKRLQAIRELEHYGFVHSYPPMGSDLDLTATYRGIVWETRLTPEKTDEPEIAHVLFTDIVGYSRLPMNMQIQLRARLKEVVRSSNTFDTARSKERVIRRSTGDGLALIFFGHPAAPVNCAIEISRALQNHPELGLRMGIHTGPVHRDEDINDEMDVAGGGINYAQRVMDAGDAGHILLSKAVADNLEQMGGWSEYLHDLGEITVKHGARVHVFNLYSDDFGNPNLPERFNSALIISQAQEVKTLEPNIVCEGEDDLFVELDKHEIFRETEYYGAGALRADTVRFANEPKAGHKVASANNVRAQIIFYDFDWPEREAHRVDYACWLDEESPYVSFDLADNAIHRLMIGVFQNKKDGSDGFEPEYIIYGNSPKRDAPLSRYVIRHSERYKVKIRLIVGEHGEFSSEHDCELEIDPGNGSFSFQYITEDEKQKRRESAHHEFIKLIAEGEAFVTTPLINIDWDKIYSDIHEWIAKVSTLIDRLFGRSVSWRFTSIGELTLYPHKISDSRRGFFDKLYTQLEHLKEIAREHGAPILPTDVSQQIQEVTDKRRKQILDDLAEFAARAKALLEYAQIKRLSLHERDLHVWDAEIFDYLSNNLNRPDTALISDENLEEYTQPENAHVSCHSFLKRVHSRLIRLNRLIEDIQSGRRAV